MDYLKETFLNYVKLGIIHKDKGRLPIVQSTSSLGKFQSTNLQLFPLVSLQSTAHY